MQICFKRIRAGLYGHRSASSEDTDQPPPHWTQGSKSATDVQSSCELDIFHLVTEFTLGDEESPTCLIQIKEGGKCHKAEEHIQLTEEEDIVGIFYQMKVVKRSQLMMVLNTMWEEGNSHGINHQA